MRCFLKIGLLAAAALLSTSARAQRPIAIGVNAGVNVASEDFDIQSDTGRSTLTGFLITGQTDWPLYGPAVLQDRLSYIEKGVVSKRTTLIAGSEQLTTDLRYIELSLAPKVKFGVLDFKPYIFLGPRLALLVSGSLTSDRGGTQTTNDIRDNFKAWDFGFDVGAGFSYPIVPRLFVLGDVGYGVGLTNILKQPIGGHDQAFSRDLKIQLGLILGAFDYTALAPDTR